MKPAAFLLVALALLASFLQADTRPQLLVTRLAAEQPAPPAPAAIPVDTVSRAKFPKADPHLIDTLSYINRLVNASIQYEDDQAQYGRPELWVMFPDSMKGDCEDYAISKLGILSDAGYPTVLFSRIRGVLVTVNGEFLGGHAILELRLPDGSIAFMDNRFWDLMTRPELEARGYHFEDW